MSARRPWAWPLVPAYAAGLAVKDRLRAAGLLKIQRLNWPVISVGSLSAGGAGKTPVVIALAELLHARGWTVDVLSRGYRREGCGVEQVQPSAEHAAQRYGDEPVLIVQRTGVPVWVAANRFHAGYAAESADRNAAARRGVHLLDDGFQHRQLARAVDVVLVTAADLEDSLLPAGNLRESFSALSRADVVVVREEEGEHVLPPLQGKLREKVAIWTICRPIAFASTRPVLSVEDTACGHFAFCGIARPEGFFAGLHSAGVGVIDTEIFADHHEYTMADIDNLIRKSHELAANAFVTTEKDEVKLSPEMRAKLEAHLPVVVARLDARFIDEDKVMRDLEARLT